jgi:hypothetical protein
MNMQKCLLRYYYIVRGNKEFIVWNMIFSSFTIFAHCYTLA